MATGFYLNKSSIYALFTKQKSGKRIRLEYYPGIVLENPDKEWDQGKQRTKDQDKKEKLDDIQKYINDIVKEIDPFTLTNETFTDLINEKLTGKKQKQTSFFEYCEIFYHENRNKLGERRAQSIRTAESRVREFKPDLTFEQINKKFYRDLINYFEDKNYKANYIGSIIKDLKRILNYATETGANTNLEYRDFKKPIERVYNIYLSEGEVEKIYNLQINEESIRQLNESQKKEGEEVKKHIGGKNMRSQIESLDRARKLFVIGCWTGLRVQNYLSIDPDIQVDLNENILHAIANKNGPKLEIPLHRLVRQILEKDGFPESISSQKLNEHIKVLGEMAGIDETIMYSRTVGGKRKIFSSPKYKMITSHTARRSFASNLLLRGIPKQFIMAITGHSTESSFNLYTQAVQKDMLTQKLKDFDVWG